LLRRDWVEGAKYPWLGWTRGDQLASSALRHNAARTLKPSPSGGSPFSVSASDPRKKLAMDVVRFFFGQHAFAHAGDVYDVTE
jgi:hypothetical protein